jgi:superfamily II DNA/RNA helicase
MAIILRRLFHSFNLKEKLVNAASKSYQRPTEIQRIAIPAIMMNQHTIICSETGTGKTLTYLLPLLNNLLENPTAKNKESPQGLILVPSRHLQLQVIATMQNLVESSLQISVIPAPEGIPKSKAQHIDVGVGTPGSILQRYPKQADLLKLLENTSFIVVDEADYMFKDESGSKLLSRIAQLLRSRKDSLKYVFVAATFPAPITPKHKTALTLIKKEFPNAVHIATGGVHQISPGLNC